MTLVLDAGALIALDRNDRAMWVRLKALLEARELAVTHGGVVGQVWRGGPRQTRLATRSRGSTCDHWTTSSVARRDGDEIVTLDREDFAILATAADRHVELVRP